jgi:hypothetical protein
MHGVERFKIMKYEYVPITNFSGPVTGLEWPRGFQEVKVPRITTKRKNPEK